MFWLVDRTGGRGRSHARVAIEAHLSVFEQWKCSECWCAGFDDWLSVGL